MDKRTIIAIFTPMIIVKLLLLPISFLYGIVTFLRNKLYDAGLLKSTSFDLPVISVGNITVGGTGKTPQIEYLVRLLQDSFQVVTLSRGYKRKTKGFRIAEDISSAQDIGDEPLQFSKKFPKISVAVDEKRVRGINNLLDVLPETEIVLLDDAFQHRSVVPGLNILLIRYSDIGERQYMMPSGFLREWRRGRDRADVIVVTKAPQVFSPIEARRITDVIKPFPYQKVYYSYVKYLEAKSFTDGAKLLLEDTGNLTLKDYKVLLVTGIAQTSSLKYYLEKNCKEVRCSEFADHHEYTMADLLRIINEFDEIVSTKKIIITTEKDSMRLRNERLFSILKNHPVFFMPIEVLIHHNEEGFDQIVNEYVQRNKRVS